MKPAPAVPHESVSDTAPDDCHECGHTAQGRFIGMFSRKRIACATEIDDGVGDTSNCWCTEMIHASEILRWDKRPVVEA